MDDKNNNLEKFFRQKFNQKIEPQDWNLPDNDVWDNIAAQIPTDKKKRRIGMLPLFIFGGGLLLATLLLGYDNYLKTNEITVLQQELKDCANLAIANDNTEINEPKPTNIDQVQDDISVKETKLAYEGTKSEFQHSLAKKKITKSLFLNSSNQLNSQENEVMKTPLNHSDINDKNMVEKLEEEQKTFTTITFPEKLYKYPLSPIVSKFAKDKSALNLFITPINPKPNKSHPFLVGPNVGYIAWQDRIQGTFDNPLSELLVKEETAPSVSYGLSLSKVLNKRVVFNTGINYYERNQLSQYAINLPYSTVDEIAVGAEFENRFQHSLPTGLGSINTNLVLSRSASSIVQNNENVYLDFALSNHIKAISIPLTLSYFVKEEGNGLFLQGGLTHEWIVQNRIKEVETESHHQFVKDKSIIVDYNDAQINRLNTSVLAGIGYQKSLTANLGITISAQYGFALNNTYQSNAYQHKIDQLNAQIRLLKSW